MGARLTPLELRIELRQWFRDGAWISSRQGSVLLLFPCALCAQVHRKLLEGDGVLHTGRTVPGA